MCSCQVATKGDLIKSKIPWKDLGCIYKQIRPDFKKSHLTQSPSLNLNFYPLGFAMLLSLKTPSSRCFTSLI